MDYFPRLIGLGEISEFKVLEEIFMMTPSHMFAFHCFSPRAMVFGLADLPLHSLELGNSYIQILPLSLGYQGGPLDFISGF